MPQVKSVSLLTMFSISGEKKLFSARAEHSKARLLYVGNQPEDLINEAISWISMDDSSVKLTSWVGKPNNLYLQLTRDKKKWTTVYCIHDNSR